MATKKKSTSKRRRPRARAKARRRGGRRSVRAAGFSMDPQNLLMAAGGALAMNAYIDAIPVEDPKMRYAIAAGGAYFLATKFPQLAPALIGAGIVAAAKAVDAFVPNLIPPPANLRAGAPMGRLSNADVRARLEDALRRRGINGGTPQMSIVGQSRTAGIVGNLPSF